MRKRLAAAIAVVLVLLLFPTTALADAELGHTGQVGRHSLRDNWKADGAWCRYEDVPPPPDDDWAAKLTYITVRRPRVNAISGTQKVGWRFIAQRSPMEYPRTWVTTYKSPIQRAKATITTIAPFTNMGIQVIPPPDASADHPGYTYRVLVRIFWYRPDGSQHGTALHQVESYATLKWLSGWVTEEDCLAYQTDYPVY